jgi:hypothetical protein
MTMGMIGDVNVSDFLNFGETRRQSLVSLKCVSSEGLLFPSSINKIRSRIRIKYRLIDKECSVPTGPTPKFNMKIFKTRRASSSPNPINTNRKMWVLFPALL